MNRPTEWTANRLRMGFVCFGRKTFDVVLAEQLMRASREALSEHACDWRFTEDLITTVEEAQDVAERLKGRIDVLITQFTTFVDGRFMEIFATALQVPVVVWAVREPYAGFGQRLALNSLTGVNMAGQRLHRLQIPFRLLYGNPTEETLHQDLDQIIRFWTVWQRLRKFTVVTLGDTPDGFSFCAPGDEAQGRLGIRVLQLDLNQTFTRALLLSDEEVQEEILAVSRKVAGVKDLPFPTVLKFAKLQTVLRQDLKRLDADAVAVRCWPEFFTEFGAAACSTLSALTEDGMMGACESDVLGALSMDVLHQLTKTPAYLGDLVEIDETSQSVVFWHCGAGAFSLARTDTGAVAGVHPNRHIGFTLEFGLKPGRITILRIGESEGGTVRALIGEGEVLDEPQRFLGTSAKVRLHGEGSVIRRVTGVMEQGFEPHYALVYGEVAGELERLFQGLRVPVTRL
jgi:L-fucose isomerase-like protein